MLEFIVRPSNTQSGEKVLSAIDRKTEALFLPLPRSLDELVVEMAFGMSYEEFVDKVRRHGLLPEPVEGWLREVRPILERIRELGDDMVTFCYRDDGAYVEGCKTSIRLAILTLRDSLRKRPDVDEWLKELWNEWKIRSEALAKEGELLREEASNYSRSTCVAGFEAGSLRKILADEFDTRLHYVGTPYHFTPLEILRREMLLKDVSRERCEQLIREHLRFMHDYVLPRGVDESHRAWTRDNLYWHPSSREGDS